ncbi:MAG: GGDEF domain-containing protein [Myxococcales bacterium]|nr:MAG: GGDEF domain-containing protein [Myxococcales bacterium]
MTQAIGGARCLEAGLKALTDGALLLTGADHASVRLCDEHGELKANARSGIGADQEAPVFRKGEGLIGWVAQTGKIARVADGRRDKRFLVGGEPNFPVCSVMSVPILSNGEVLGVVSLSASKPDAFGAEDEAIGELLANCALQAVRMSELEQLAITDPHTRAYNRHFLGPCLNREMQRSRRLNSPLSILFMDLDHFKQINDEHGHAVGDAVLRAFVRAVRECVREVDVLIRRGGEEFVLSMPNTDTEGAYYVAERIRLCVRQQPLRVHDATLLVQTVSIGVATWDGHENAESLEHRADAAMYEAKRQGRNRVVVAAHRPSGIHDLHIGAPMVKAIRE